MRVIGGIRYRPEDAPGPIEPTRITQAEPEAEVTEPEPSQGAKRDLDEVAPSVAAAAKRKPKASRGK